MIQKWYRGYNGKQKPTDNFGIIWLTDDPDYAQLYADEYGDEGRVAEFDIDESKLNPADTYYDNDFDYYFPDMKKVREYQEDGFNCYTFPIQCDDIDCDGLALFDESPIVNIRILNKEDKIHENIMKLTDKDLSYIISEATKRIVMNEISWGTAHDANEKSENRVDMLDDAWMDFSDAADKLVRALEGFSDESWYKDDAQPLNSQGSILASKLAQIQNQIYQYIERKRTQKFNLNDYEGEKFRDAFGGRDFDQVANDIEAKSVEHDENWYDENGRYIPWREYRKQHLTKDEQDFNDRNP